MPKLRLKTWLMLGNMAVLLLITLLAKSPPGNASLQLPTLAQLPTVTYSPVPSASASLAPPTMPALPPEEAATQTNTSTPEPTATAFPIRTQSTAHPEPSLTPSLTITPTFTSVILSPLEITFEGVYSLALEFRRPVQLALEGNRLLLTHSRLTVSAYRDIHGWAKITLVPTSVVESGWANVETIVPVEIIARQISPGEWIAYLVGSDEFERIATDVPRWFVDYVSPLPPLEGAYRFPWHDGEVWWAIQGWHDGNALDFQPGIGARFGVLAAQAGRLREICSDGYQSLLEIQHFDGRSTYYLHVRLALTTRRERLDQVVQRGQYLGELIGQPYFVTACGRGRSRHLHFAVSDRGMTFEAYPLEGVAASASCCANPPDYQSSNVRYPKLD